MMMVLMMRMMMMMVMMIMIVMARIMMIMKINIMHICTYIYIYIYILTYIHIDIYNYIHIDIYTCCFFLYMCIWLTKYIVKSKCLLQISHDLTRTRTAILEWRKRRRRKLIWGRTGLGMTKTQPSKNGKWCHKRYLIKQSWWRDQFEVALMLRTKMWWENEQ